MKIPTNTLTLSDNAVRQIKESAAGVDMTELNLRFAINKKDTGEFQYAMGFDDINNDQDLKYEEKGINVSIDQSSIDLFEGTVLDYVKLDDGEMQFVFSNPNDPNYSAE